MIRSLRMDFSSRSEQSLRHQNFNVYLFVVVCIYRNTVSCLMVQTVSRADARQLCVCCVACLCVCVYHTPCTCVCSCTSHNHGLPPHRHCEHCSSRWESHNDLCVQFLPCVLWSTEGTRWPDLWPCSLTRCRFLSSMASPLLSHDTGPVGTQTHTLCWTESVVCARCLFASGFWQKARGRTAAAAQRNVRVVSCIKRWMSSFSESRSRALLNSLDLGFNFF